MADTCMVNHELADDLFLALLEQQAETRKMLQRAMGLVRMAAKETPYWGDAEEFLAEGEALLARISPGKAKMLEPGEEPF
jgi:hypothetical protein